VIYFLAAIFYSRGIAEPAGSVPGVSRDRDFPYNTVQDRFIPGFSDFSRILAGRLFMGPFFSGVKWSRVT